MINALKKLGTKIEYLGKSNIKVEGNPKFANLPKEEPQIYLGNSGTSSRFLIAFIACISHDYSVVFTADERLSQRPMTTLINLLLQYHLIEVEYLVEGRTFPMRVRTFEIKENISELKIDCSETSQFASALLMISPLLSTVDITIQLEGDVVSESYITITVEMMKHFGVDISYDQENKK
mmetsp:Transcript_20462/g.18107  ORF Transcript_20462/g.18107 Transcript_20462/m.18107 type:complete len:179 (-) Transcript_20462:1392-1928(-)